MEGMSRKNSVSLNYWLHSAVDLPPIGGGQEDYGPERVIVDKVFDECTVVECPRVRFISLDPEPANVVDCEVTSVNIVEPVIPREGQVAFTVEWAMEITYTDADGYEHLVSRTFRFRKQIRLRGARPGMDLRFFHLVRCLNSQVREVENETDVIESEVGLFVVVKATFEVQLEIERARYSPQPPECVQVSPIGCPEFVEMAQSGAFWPPFPPQID